MPGGDPTGLVMARAVAAGGPGPGRGHAGIPTPSDGHAGVAGVPLWSLDAADTAALLVRAAQAEAALAGLRLAPSAHADTAGVAELTGAPSTAAWCRGVLRMPPGPAKADLRLA
ncbi:MAG TPA: hypothetical protein VFR74_04220, partial [Jiangellales bacterium]|nr:hypothetical protein [Jiangellales bacterium]